MGLQAAGAGESTFPRRLGAASLDISRVIGPGLAGVWFALFVMVGKPNSSADVYSTTLLVHFLFAVPALAYGAWLIHQRRLPGPTALDWSALALVITFAVAIVDSVNPRVSLEASLGVAMGLIAFYGVYDVKALSVSFWSRLLWMTAALVALMGVLSFVIQYSQWLSQVSSIKGGLGTRDLIPPTIFRIDGVLNHPSPFAMFLNLAMPFAAADALRSKGAARVAILGVLGLGALAIFLSVTRGAWIATAVWLFVFVLLIGRAQIRRHLQHHMDGSWLRVAVPAGLVVGVLVAITTAAVLDVRPDWLFRSTLDDRWESWRTGIAIFRDNWLTGAGPYTFLLLDDLYAARDSGLAVIPHSHNIYVQVLADLGVAGGAVMLAGTAVLFAAYKRVWRLTGGPDRYYVAAGIASTIGFMVHNLTDAPPSWNSVTVPFAIVVALTLRYAPAAIPAPKAGSRAFARLTLVLLIPAVLLAWMSFNAAHSHYDHSIEAQAEGQLDLAVSEAVQAYNSDSLLFAYALQAGVVSVQAYEQQASPDPVLFDQGIKYIRRAIELEPHSSLGYANLAIALQIKGDREGAVEAARSAVAHNPGGEDIQTAAGTVLEWAGMRTEAVHAYAAALNLDPNLTQAPFWATTPERLELRSEAIAASELTACEAGYSAAMFGVYTDDLVRLADQCSAVVERDGLASDRARLALILHRLGQDNEAIEQARLAESAAPRDNVVLVATAAILSPDVTEARLHLLQARVLLNRDAGIFLASTYQPGAGKEFDIQLPFPSEAAPLPSSMIRTLPVLSTDEHYEPGMAASARSILYYSWAAARQSPVINLIPGDWSDMVSPRTLLAFELRKIATGQARP